MSARADARATRLIVNADDFGYFEGVSRGILDLAEQGVVTATGIMANGPAVTGWFERLRRLPALSLGVHLNVTLGRPLTQQMASELAWNDGEFPGKGGLLAGLLRGRIRIATIVNEWRAQIRVCRDADLPLRFLNSHEHIHMLPALHRKARALADECGIAHLRAPRPEWGPRTTVAGLLRSGVFAAAQLLEGLGSRSEPLFIGLNPSGRLSLDYCEWRFARLRRGTTYELMCHPGHDDPLARRDPKLGHYHDWDGEFATLQGAPFAQLLGRHGIELTPYTAEEEGAR
jgi:predicted glycoside hydrolase/deacetylase ChbG (UPF0249 family)